MPSNEEFMIINFQNQEYKGSIIFGSFIYIQAMYFELLILIYTYK